MVAHPDRVEAGLLGRSPRSVWRSRQLPRVTEEELRVALTIRESRQIRGDGTLTIGGAEWEAEHGFLAGKTVTIARTLADPQASPWIEEENKHLKLRRVDPRANAGRKRKRKTKRVRRGLDAIDFDPPSAFVDALVGRRRPRKGGK